MAEKEKEEQDVPEDDVEKTGPDCIWDGLMKEEKLIKCIKPINIVSMIYSICGGVMIFLCVRLSYPNSKSIFFFNFLASTIGFRNES